MILAIETSHDDSSLALYENKKIIWERTITQTEFHKKFGGTIPEFAARKHYENLYTLVEEAKENFDLSKLEHIAYTYMPGLIGSLHMGQLLANGLGLSLDVPVFKVNHMYAHIFAVEFEHTIEYPAIALIVSGGHSQIWKLTSTTDIKLLGETKDDAAGEVFDKVARKLAIGFPGGPVIQNIAKNNQEIDFSLKDDGTLNFSFSGLKTKVINYVHNLEQKKQEIDIPSIAYHFQESITNSLISKTIKAIKLENPKSIILGGGVAANKVLREKFEKIHTKVLIPSFQYTTDNAMMIAIRSDIVNSPKK